MKKSRLLGALCAAVFSFISLPTHATLSYVLGGLAVYDDVADLSWTTNANINGLMTWQEANDWAATLEIDGVGGWRLPTTLQPDASCGSQFDPGGGFDVQGYGTGCTGSEMGNLFNVEGVTAALPGLFDSVQSGRYWSSTEYAPVTGYAWDFDFNFGDQDVSTKVSGGFAWAVQSGNVGEVPVPAAVWLFGSGLLGLIGLGRQRRR
jgi:hypothetical protein